MTYVIVGFTLGFAILGIALCFKAYRLLRGRARRAVEQPRLSERDTRDADTIWELGRRTAVPVRRGFLRRFALGLIGALVAQRAARGDEFPAGAEFLKKEGHLNNPDESLQNSQIAQSSHIDVPGPGGSYADFAPRPHSDRPPPHSDSPPPHSDRPHTDTPHGDSRG